MEQKKLTKGKLLNVFGNLDDVGYATSLVRDYAREDIKAGKMRIKEWDYYYIGNNFYGVALTIADNSYMGMGSVSILDFRDGFWKTKSQITLFPMGKTNLPPTSAIGDCHFKKGNMEISFFNDGTKRRLLAKVKNYLSGQDFNCDITLSEEPKDSMVIATPFFKKKAFLLQSKDKLLKGRWSSFIR